MDLSYALTPFLAWLVAGVLKFLVNSLRAGKLAFGLIGYGGLPSNHSAIVSSTAALIAFKEGLAHPAFGVAVTLAINALVPNSPERPWLRERMGHTRLEIAAGIAVGIAVATAVHELLTWLAARP